jgi:hypothetical protein
MLRPLNPRSEETVVTGDPSRATLIDKEECSMPEDNGNIANNLSIRIRAVPSH